MNTLSRLRKVLSGLTLGSLLIGATAWAAPVLEVYDGTTKITATSPPVNLLVTGTPTIPVANTSVRKTITVKNAGSDTLNISALTLAQNPSTIPPSPAGLTGCSAAAPLVNPFFAQPTLTATSIAAGASATFDILFDLRCSIDIATLPAIANPLQFLTLTGNVQIVSNDGGPPSALFKFPVNGIITTAGVPDVRVLDDKGNEIQYCAAAPTTPVVCLAATATTPPSPQFNAIVDFGSVSLNGTAITKTFNLLNIGSAPATLTTNGITVAGAATVTAGITFAPGVTSPLASTAFTVTPYTTTNLPVGSMVPFSVTLGSTTAGVFGALVNVANGNVNMLAGNVTATPAAPTLPFPMTNSSATAVVTIPAYLGTLAATGATLPVGFTNPTTAPALPVPPTGAGSFGVMGRVTPLPVLEVVDGTTVIADNTGVVSVGTLLKGDVTNNLKTFTVRNVGGLAANLTNPITLTNTSGSAFSLPLANFAVTNLAGSTAPPAPGGSTTFQVKMDTTQLGMFEAEVSFGNDDPNKNPYNFKLKGAVVGSLLQEIEIWYGTPAEVAAGTAIPLKSGIGTTPGSEIDFSTPVGTDVTKTFTVRNTGGTKLNLSYLSTPLPTAFALASVFPHEVLAGNTATFDIELDGSTAGQYGGTLYVFNDDEANPSDNNDGKENPFNFRVKAMVKAPAPEIQVLDDVGTDIDITVPTEIDFGSKPRGTNVSKIFTVKNIGDKLLTLTSHATVTGAGFLITSFEPGTVAPNGTTTFTVTLNADTPGTFNSEVSFANDDSDEGTFTFPITAIVENTPPANQAIEVWYGTPADITAGTATPITDGTLTAAGTAIDLTKELPGGNTPVGTYITKTFTVRNIGSKDLNLFGASQPEGIKIVGTLPFTVVAGGEVTFQVELNAAVAGKKGGTFQLFNNDSSKTPFDFPLTGLVGVVEVPPTNVKLTVAVKGPGSVDSTSPVGVGITNCIEGATTGCSVDLPAGTTSVTLTAKNGTVAWSGTDCKVGATPDTAIVTVSPTATAVTCNADFSGTTTTIPLTVKVTGNGSVESTTPAGIITACTATGGTCTGNVPTGTTSVTLTAKPVAGETVTWGPGCAAGTEPNTGTVSITSGLTQANCNVAFTAVPPTGDLPLTVKIIGNGTVDSVIPTGLGLTGCTSSGGVCTVIMPTGTKQVVLSAKPTANESVTWGPGCDGVGYTGVVNVTTGVLAQECTATFKAPPAVLTVMSNGDGLVTNEDGKINCGTGAAQCTSEYAAGATASLNAQAGDGFAFLNWTGDCTGTDNPLTMTMNASKTCVANFGAPTFTVSKTGNGVITSGDGQINCGTAAALCNGGYPIGSTVTLTATPDAGYTFKDWSGDCTGTTSPLAVKVDTGAKTCTANFVQPVTKILTISKPEGGSVTGNNLKCGSAGDACKVTLPSGERVELTATPDANFAFKGWTADCAAQGTTSPLSITLTDNQTCSAKFDSMLPTQATLNFTASDNGTISTKDGRIDCGTKCTATYNLGEVVLLAATSVSATFEHWDGDCGTGTTTPLTLNVNQEMANNPNWTCKAVFKNLPSVEEECFKSSAGVLSKGNQCIGAPELPAETGAGEPTTAKMRGGISKFDGAYLQRNTVTVIDPVTTAGVIQVAPEDVGKPADIVVIGRHDDPDMYAAIGGFAWYMMVPYDSPLGWTIGVLPFDPSTGKPILTAPELVALKHVDVLPKYYTVYMYSGNFFYPGPLQIKFGYRVDGKTILNSTPIDITILPVPK